MPRRSVNKRIKPCYMEMLTLMSCFKARVRRRACMPPAADACGAALQRAAFDDAKCVSEINALTDCMAANANKSKEMNSINYHLQRLGNKSKR